MKKVYEAEGSDKRDLIELFNELKAFDRAKYFKDEIGISDFLMIGRTNRLPLNSIANIQHWNLNGLMENTKSEGEIIIIEPLEEQINNSKLVKLSEVDTYFDSPIELSNRAIILMQITKYDELYQNEELKDAIDNMNIRLYEGEEDLAVKMLFFDKGYIYININENGYLLDKRKDIDLIPYVQILLEKQKQIEQEMKMNIKDTVQNVQKFKVEKGIVQKKAKVIEGQAKNYRMITGLTNKVEGDAELDDEIYATTDIGKMRENQEDAILLIKDQEIPNFKMMVVADGMGGWQKGEIASNEIVNKLKEWFENLSEEEKKCYYTGVIGLKKSLQEKIEIDIQVSVEDKTWWQGGSTLVCAIVGENDTLISNIGDSRAYIIKNGKLEQISREDTVAQRNLEKGKTPNKEASRFDSKANELTQCIGMDRRQLQQTHFEILNNKDYDMLLLFSDGVTDCLSEEDIAVVCKNSNRKEVTKSLVEKAIKHDSIQPEEFMDYTHLNGYIPGGKDNTTAVAYIPKKDKEVDR